MPRRPVLASLLALPLLAACPAALAPAPADAPATFDGVMKHALSNCSTRSCHGPEGRKGGLQLTADVAYAQLVGVPAQHEAARAKGKLRVKPGEPDASFLVQKLEGPSAGEGERMPNRGPGLPPETIALVRRWIAAGCPK